VPILKPRTRIVYFRVSEEEFLRLVDLCPAHGARSISELARNAMQGIIRGAADMSREGDVAQKLDAIDKTMTEMSQNLKRLIPAGAEDNRDNA
jgi:hypothetical protein